MNGRRDYLLGEIGWALIVAVGGLVLHSDVALIGLIAVLPLAAIGLWTLIGLKPPIHLTPQPPLRHHGEGEQDKRSARSGRWDNFAPLGSVREEAQDTSVPQLERVTREVERAAGTLIALTAQQKSDAGEQTRLIQQSSRLLEEYNALADRARREAVGLAAAGIKTRTVTQTGRQTIGAAIGSLNGARVQTEAIASTLTTLARHVRRINEIVAAVDEIATQSNFLALNAAIEAARAGEGGSAFATVAEEVRALAEQSRKAVIQIRAVLVEIHKSMAQTVDTVEAGAQSIEQGIALTRQAESAIGQLEAALDTSSSAVQKVTAAVDRQAGGLEQMAEAVNGVGRMTLQAQASLQMADMVASEMDKLSRELRGDQVASK